MDLDFSFGILGALKQKIEKIIFYEAYSFSHKDYLKFHNRLLFRYMAEGIEVDVYLENKHLSNEELPLSKLYLKTSSNNEYKRLTGHILAYDGSVVYQNPVNVLFNKPEELIIYYLPNLPLKEVFIDDGVYTTYSEVELKGELEDSEGNKKEVDHRIGGPTYTEFLNSEWERKWGAIWNLDFLVQEYRNYRLRLIVRLAGSLALLHTKKTSNEKFRKKYSDYGRFL